MKAVSIILKILAVIVFASAFTMIDQLEAFIESILYAFGIFAIGVLFRNLGEAFEDIALIRERQKKELTSKGILTEE